VLTQAGQLDQSLGLSFMGSYYTNFQGHNEKWLQGADAQYFLLPNGELRRWHDMQYSYGPAGLVATLGANFYANPELLWNPASVLSVSGNQLTIHRPGGLSGNSGVEVATSDGQAATTGTFNLLVLVNSPPTLTGLTNLSMSHTQDKLVVNVSASDPDG